MILSENRNEKGLDARHKNGLTFEIKTRRVYESGRRISETRRLNNLVGKTADFLIVVALNRSFKCSGMWLIPMKNLENPKSANLKVVNNTPGTQNLIPSQISWLKTGKKFTSFDSITVNKLIKTNPKRRIRAKNKMDQSDDDELEIISKDLHSKYQVQKNKKKGSDLIENKSLWQGIWASIVKNDDTGGCVTLIFLFFLLLYLIGFFL